MVKHIACIMDGNRRWAKQQGKFPWDGHKEGVQAAVRAMDFCLAQNISYLSLYTFSLENFNRPLDEQRFLFTVLLTQVRERAVTELVEKGVRVKFVGDRTKFPNSALSAIDEMERITKNCSKLQVNLLFCYGGRQEIMAGVKNLIAKAQKGAIALDKLSEEQLQEELWSAGIPAPEIIVRTGGARRLSNFLLFQAAYSELFFLDSFWPDLSPDQLQKILQEYETRQKNFGK